MQRFVWIHQTVDWEAHAITNEAVYEDGEKMLQHFNPKVSEWDHLGLNRMDLPDGGEVHFEINDGISTRIWKLPISE